MFITSEGLFVRIFFFFFSKALSFMRVFSVCLSVCLPVCLSGLAWIWIYATGEEKKVHEIKKNSGEGIEHFLLSLQASWGDFSSFFPSIVINRFSPPLKLRYANVSVEKKYLPPSYNHHHKCHKSSLTTITLTNLSAISPLHSSSASATLRQCLSTLFR